MGYSFPLIDLVGGGECLSRDEGVQRRRIRGEMTGLLLVAGIAI